MFDLLILGLGVCFGVRLLCCLWICVVLVLFCVGLYVGVLHLWCWLGGILFVFAESWCLCLIVLRDRLWCVASAGW